MGKTFCFLPTLIDFFIAALKNPWSTHGFNEKLQKCIWSSHSFLFAKVYFYSELFGMLQLSVKLEKSKTFSSKNHNGIFQESTKRSSRSKSRKVDP